MVEIAASILNMSSENTIQTLYNLEASGIQYFHIDVMDGKFVKNNTKQKMLEYCEYLNHISNLPLDVHLMVKDVEKFLAEFSVFNPNIITFHLEAAKDKEEILKWINQIKQNHVKVGIALKPNTNIKEIEEFLPFLHLVLVMTVEPGEGGQPLLSNTLERIKSLAEYRKKNQLEFMIEADGGIKLENCEQVKQAGADILVSGTGILKSESFSQAVKALRK